MDRVSRGFWIVWTLIVHALSPVLYCQVISNSSQLNERVFCPKEDIILTCITTGSPSIAWTSEEYIERGGNSLGFDPRDGEGATQRSPVNSNTVATLTGRSTVNGMVILESKLHIIISSEFLTASVSCIHGDGSKSTIRFHTLADPGVPRGITLNQRKDVHTQSYMLLLGWNNFLTDDVSQYMIYVNGTNVLNETNNINENLTLTAYRVCNGGAHQISVSAINRCGQESQRSLIMTVDVELELSFGPECGNVTQPIGNQGGDVNRDLLEGPAIYLFIIGIIGIVLFAIVLFAIITIVLIRKKLNIFPISGKKGSSKDENNEISEEGTTKV